MIHNIVTHGLIFGGGLARTIESDGPHRVEMLINAELLPLTLPANGILADRVLVVPRTVIGGVRRHHILLVRSLINVDGSLLNSAFLERLRLLLQPLRVLLVRLDQLDLLLRAFVVLLILLILQSDLLVC